MKPPNSTKGRRSVEARVLTRNRSANRNGSAAETAAPTPKIFVALPSYGAVPMQFASSLLHMMQDLPASCQIGSVGGDSLIPRARNNYTAQFLASDCTHLLSIDTDEIFSSDHVRRLLSHDVDIVGGFYPKKTERALEWVCNTLPDQPEPDANGLQPLLYIGTGFMLVKRSVFEKIIEAIGDLIAYEADGNGALEHDFWKTGIYDFFTKDMVRCGRDWRYRKTGRRYLSEDWFFCQRCQELGIPVYGDVHVILRHVGSATYPLKHQQHALIDPTKKPVKRWDDIHGWFTAEDANVYWQIAKSLSSSTSSSDSRRPKVAEIGTWMGRSLAAFINFCELLGKKPQIHAIDTFKGTANEGDAHLPIVKACGGSVRSIFEANMKKLGAELSDRINKMDKMVSPLTHSENSLASRSQAKAAVHSVRPLSITVHEKTSLEAARDFKNGELDAVFIDGDHSQEAVKADIAAWLPKVKRGGIIAGHDYDYEGVAAAVSAAFQDHMFETYGRCWLVRL